MSLGLSSTPAVWQSNFDATPTESAAGVTVTAAGSAHTKGSYIDLINPVAFDSSMLMLNIMDTAVAATNTDMLLDIAIGPTGGGSEQVIVPDLLVGWREAASNRLGALQLYLPIFIPKGVALRARCQAVTASDNVDVLAVLHQGYGIPWRTFAGCDAYGINSSGDSSGTSHTPGASGSESAYASIGGTTSKNYRAIMFLAHPTNTTTTNLAYHFELGISSATPPGAEWYVMETTTEEIMQFPCYPYHIEIPSGTQLQVRAEASGASPLAHDVAFYGFY